MKNFNYKIIIMVILASILLAFGYNYEKISTKGLSFLTSKGPAISDSLLNAGIASATNDELEGGTVTYEQIKARIDDPNFIIIDARSEEDYAKKHIGNSINIFPHSDESKYFEKIYTLPRDKKFIIYCNGGNCDLSHQVAEDMKIAGFKNIFIYTSGWEEWETK
ncbi:rhodanese-like domain-containing protein [bacterium]|nr:MAG: rhodanese-like domain-containing protein [bacterium]